MSIDRGVFRLVVGIVGAALLLCVAGVVTLSVVDKPLPVVLTSLATGTLAALVSLLVHPPASSTPTPVTTAPGEALAVKDVEPYPLGRPEPLVQATAASVQQGGPVLHRDRVRAPKGAPGAGRWVKVEQEGQA